MAKKKAKPTEVAFREPRIKRCDFCKGSFDLNGYGWVVSAAKKLFCSHECMHSYWKRAERLERGEATWKDVTSL
jgi:hypothetical protein